MDKNSTFSSERLYFRGINENDTGTLISWRSDPKMIRYFRRTKPITKEGHEQWYINVYSQAHDRFDFIVIEKKAKKAIGTVGVSHIDYKKSSCEISYMIADPDYQRKGYAVEAISTMMGMMMRENVFKFFAEVHEKNIASRRTIEKLNFIYCREKLPFIIYYRQENTDAAYSS